MDERKYTADEIAEALVRCDRMQCEKCPFQPDIDCLSNLRLEALGLIDLQRKEIERLRQHNSKMAHKHYNDGKQDAVKAYTEALKTKAREYFLGMRFEHFIAADVLSDFDELVESTVEELKDAGK